MRRSVVCSGQLDDSILRLRPHVRSRRNRGNEVPSGHTAAWQSGLEEHVPAKERVWLELARYDDGALPQFLASQLDLSEKTIRNKLTELRKDKRAIQADDRGRWLALRSTP